MRRVGKKSVLQEPGTMLWMKDGAGVSTETSVIFV
jgi:hypothetical protein